MDVKCFGTFVPVGRMSDSIAQMCITEKQQRACTFLFKRC